jgi:hypothetical protein
MKMKWIGAVFLFAMAVALSPSCQAGSGSEERDVKKPAQKVSAKSQKTQSIHRSHIAMEHRETPGSCRDAYCRYAAGCAWWPGAPGD